MGRRPDVFPRESRSVRQDGTRRLKNTPHRAIELAEAIAVLRWWKDAGVDLAIEDAPRRRFALFREQPYEAGIVAATPRVERPSAPTVASFEGSSTVTAASRELAVASADLGSLRETMETFGGCALKRTATQLVFADGVPGSRVMLVGEAPGGEEDRIGRPFVGRAGQLLDRMLASIGLDRSTVYIANIVPWRPPGNRTPTPQETEICLPFIRRQIQLAAPDILVCLGGSAARTLLGIREGITRARGRWSSFQCEDGRTLRALAMLHPAYLLRQPGHKRYAWLDLRALSQSLHMGSEQKLGSP